MHHTWTQRTTAGLVALAAVLGLLADPVSATLVHRYTFENGAADNVGGLDGTPSGASIDTGDAIQGSYSAEFSGDDHNDYIGFDATAFNATAFSVAMWVQPDSFYSNHGFGGDQALLSNKTGGAADGFSLYFEAVHEGTEHGGTLKNETANGTDSSTASSNAKVLFAGEWQHAAYTIDRAGGTCGIYLDGLDETVGSAIRTDFEWDAPWRLGLFTDGGYDFYGRLDDVQIYDEVLSAGDVAFLADNPGAVIPEPVTTIGLLLGGAALTAYSRRRRRKRRPEGGRSDP